MSPRKPIYRVVINSWALDDENKRPRWQFTTWKDYYLFICLLFRSMFGLNQPVCGWRQRSPTTAKFLLVDPRAASARSVVYMLYLIVLIYYQLTQYIIYIIYHYIMVNPHAASARSASLRCLQERHADMQKARTYFLTRKN